MEINLTPENQHLIELMEDITGMSHEGIINKCIFDSIRLYYPLVWCCEGDVFSLYYDKRQKVIKSTDKKQAMSRTNIEKPKPQ
jgi:hypothetical protein